MTPGPQITTYYKFSLFISGKHVPLITTNYPTPGIKQSSLTALICFLSGRIFQVHKVTARTCLAVCTIPGVAETAHQPPVSTLPFFCIPPWVHGCPEQLSLPPYLPGNWTQPRDLNSGQWKCKWEMSPSRIPHKYPLAGGRRVMASSLPFSSFLLAGAGASLDQEEEITC